MDNGVKIIPLLVMHFWQQPHMGRPRCPHSGAGFFSSVNCRHRQARSCIDDTIVASTASRAFVNFNSTRKAMVSVAARMLFGEIATECSPARSNEGLVHVAGQTTIGQRIKARGARLQQFQHHGLAALSARDFGYSKTYTGWRWTLVLHCSFPRMHNAFRNW